MIKTILLVALAISAHAAAPTAVGTCTGTFTQCAQCISSAMVAAASAEVCATCNTGFSLPSTLACTGIGCSTSIANCGACSTTATVCSACISNAYALDTTNNVCVPCATATTGYTGGAGAGVLTCSVNTQKVISALTCDTTNGYVLDSTASVCVNCQTAKATAGTNTYGTGLPGYQCTLSGGNVAASTAANPCIPKYAKDLTTPNALCISCTSAATGVYAAGDANAASCSWSGAAGAQTYNLLSCNTGYVFDSTNSACASCSTGKSTSGTAYTGFVTGASGCSVNTAKAITAITACGTGYYFDTNSACISCSTGKGTSVSAATTYSYSGFDANCAMCGAGSAATNIACTGCNAGFFLYYNGTCGNGTANDTSCQYFANQVHCVQCKTGLATTASNACVACPANCNLCDTTGKVCSVCGTGYKLSSTATGTCVPNSANIIVPGLALLSAIFYFLF